MKKFSEFKATDLQTLRCEIVLNSLFVCDYENSFGISAKSICDFFDGYYDFIWELAKEDDKERDWSLSDVLDKYDNIDTLIEWYYCFDNFDWVEYVEDCENVI